jgi:NAD(P)-dependent dehydrogenase (short-subunit alcohol dehydrogenase family)
MGMLEGKVIAVTGAGRGIGRGEALLLAAEGARVVVNDLGGEWDGTGSDPRLASQVVEEITASGGDAAAHFEDISEAGGAASLLQRAIDTWGQIDGLVNNAGILRDRMVFNMAPEEWDAVIKVHLRGTFLCTREVSAHWRERSKAGDPVSGRIVNTSSTSGLLGMSGQSNYGAAKAAIAGLTQIASMELARYGVTVNAIAPGARTRMTEKTFGELTVPEGEFDALAPENIAPMVAFLCSDDAAHITGQVFGVQGGLVQLYQGWTPTAEIDKAARWEVAELAKRVEELFEGRQSAYTPQRSPLRRLAGIGDGS